MGEGLLYQGHGYKSLDLVVYTGGTGHVDERGCHAYVRLAEDIKYCHIVPYDGVLAVHQVKVIQEERQLNFIQYLYSRIKYTS